MKANKGHFVVGGEARTASGARKGSETGLPLEAGGGGAGRGSKAAHQLEGSVTVGRGL